MSRKQNRSKYDLLSVLVIHICFVIQNIMPTKETIVNTRSILKRKLLENIVNAPIKKARVLITKQLAFEYINTHKNNKY